MSGAKIARPATVEVVIHDGRRHYRVTGVAVDNDPMSVPCRDMRIYKSALGNWVLMSNGHEIARYKTLRSARYGASRLELS